jgi:DNA-binding GntR family transcriptional regulator
MVFHMPNLGRGVAYLAHGSLDGLQPLDVKPESLAQMVYASIRKAIVSKTLMPGTVVSEASVARRLAVSKTPVREALLRLQSVGLVEPDAGRGLRIVMPSEDAIRDAYEVRQVLEAGLCQAAASRGTAAQREAITSAARGSLESAEKGDIEGFRDWDHNFHKAIAQAAGNPRLAQLAEDAMALASVLRERDVPGVQDAIRCAHQHLEIADAIVHGQPHVAADAAQRHTQDVADMVLSAFRQRSSSKTAGWQVSGGTGREVDR